MTETPSLARRVVAIGKMIRALHKANQELLTTEHPGWTRCDARITGLRDAAVALAHEDRTDVAAVAALRRAASRRTRNLLYAAASVRSEAWVGENAITFRANELLQSAATGRPVWPVSDERRALFARVAELTGVGRDVAFTRLVALCPAMAVIPRTTKDERLSDTYQRVGAALTPLLGPDDTLLRSHTAHDMAFEHLMTEEPVALTARTGVYTAHTGAVLCQGSVGHDDRMPLLTGGADATAQVWDLADGTVMHTLTGHDGPVRAVAHAYVERWRDDENGEIRLAAWQAVVTGGDDATARLWHRGTGELVHTLTGHRFGRRRGHRTGSGRGHRRAVQVWDLADGALVYVLAGHDGPIRAVWYLAFHDRHRIAITCGQDATVRVWDPNTGTAGPVLRGAEGPVINALLVFDPQWMVVAASADGTARLWDFATGELLRTFAGHDGALTGAAAAFVDDRGVLVTSGADGTVRLWDIEAGTPHGILTEHLGGVTTLSCLRMTDGPVAVSSGADGAVHVRAVRPRISTST